VPLLRPELRKALNPAACVATIRCRSRTTESLTLRVGHCVPYAIGYQALTGRYMKDSSLTLPSL
jgi:hypothetical protein